MKTDIKVADKMLVIAPAITIWSARKKMNPEDYGLEKDSLPPDEIASLGVKKLCPLEKLRPFAMLKARATSLLARHGVPFLPGAWLIPADDAAYINKALGQIKAEFEHEKDAFLMEYDSICADWVKQHPEYAEMLSRSMASPDYVRSRLAFGWRAFSLKMTRNSNIKDEMENLGNSVFADIAKEAKCVQREVFSGKETVTQKALSPIRNLGEKLRALSFIHPQIGMANTLVKFCLEHMPAKGEISGAHLGMVMALVTLLSNPVALEDATNRMTKNGIAPGLVLSPAPMAKENKQATKPIPQTSMIDNI